MAGQTNAGTGAMSRGRQLGAMALVAAVGGVVFLPLGAIGFLVVTFVAWKWAMPPWVKAVATGITVILLVLLTFALPRTFESGSVSIK